MVAKKEDMEREGIRFKATDEEKAAVETAHQREKGRSIRYVQMSQITPESVLWLWEPYIPLKKITLIEGDPAAGKTWLALALAAAISTGSPLPDPETGRCLYRREPSNVIYMSAEDGMGDTIRPRLDALEADASKVWAIQGVQSMTGEDIFTFEDIFILFLDVLC